MSGRVVRTKAKSREPAGRRASGTTRFDNEWIFHAFEDHPSFFTKRMFGGLAAYLFGRMMLVLVEPTKTGRWNWHGVLVCTEYAHHRAIAEEFPHLEPHDILRKWLYIDSRHGRFERTMEQVAEAIARNDPRFGVHPRPSRRSSRSSKPKRSRGTLRPSSAS
jgi:hypothetical protein